MRFNRRDWNMAAEGVWQKVLYQDPDGTRGTYLMYLAPETQTEGHSHTVLEEIFVLEGSFRDAGKRYGRGDYCVRAAGQNHSAGTTEGCLALVIYR